MEFTIEPMDPEVKKAWLSALRSGRFPQTHHHLKDDFGNCCLGVLEEISPRTSWVREAEGKVTIPGVYLATDTTNPHAIPRRGALTQETEDWAGLSRGDPHVYYAGTLTTLTNLNDQKKLTFAEIADIIEEQL